MLEPKFMYLYRDTSASRNLFVENTSNPFKEKLAILGAFHAVVINPYRMYKEKCP